MSSRRSAWLALILLTPAPTIGAAAALWWWPGTTLGMSVYAACKLWLLALPVLWHLGIDRARPHLSRPSRAALNAGWIWGLIIAVAIVYLVMAVLFESFVFPLIIILSVPLATAGGIGGLALLNTYTYQALDMLTLLGFVILIGIVVNNAILLVHQTLYHARHDGMDSENAIVAATRNRIRPIFMSTLTSVCGMLPLVLFPGAGSELYRGLGSVVVGGLALSAVLTLAIIPPLLTLIGRLVEVGPARTTAPEGHPAE